MVNDPRNFYKRTHPFMPKHDVADRSIINHNGAIIPEYGIFVRSGSVTDISGSETGSIELNFDASALRLRRVEVFHAGPAANFNFRMENSTPNTGSFFDPRNIVVCYREVPGSLDYTEGVDQIEDMFVLTDETTSENRGNLYLKFMPYSTGVNSFKYLLFFEAVMIYVNREGNNA